MVQLKKTNGFDSLMYELDSLLTKYSGKHWDYKFDPEDNWIHINISILHPDHFTPDRPVAESN